MKNVALHEYLIFIIQLLHAFIYVYIYIHMILILMFLNS